MTSLPYITSHGNIEKALAAIKVAAVPTKVSLDFIKTVLKIPGSSGNQMSAFLKKLNFIAADGTPTSLYKKFRNDSTSGQALAEAIKYAYKGLYMRNEFAHKLSDEELRGRIVEETGSSSEDRSVKLILACLKDLMKNADFEAEKVDSAVPMHEHEAMEAPYLSNEKPVVASQPSGIGFNLGYTINLNLPATSDAAVFNAIFKSLKQHLLRDDDA